MNQLPAELGYRMPAEWEPHEATWIAWPHNRDDWPGKFPAIAWAYAEIVRHLHQAEPVHVLVNDERAERQRLIQTIRYTVNSDLLFASGSWQMSKAGETVIARLASQLAPNQRLKLVVNGYTDNQPVGAALKKRGVTTNQALSERRAQAVMQFMIAHGVKQDLVTARGQGENSPLASNTARC